MSQWHTIVCFQATSNTESYACGPTWSLREILSHSGWPREQPSIGHIFKDELLEMSISRENRPSNSAISVLYVMCIGRTDWVWG